MSHEPADTGYVGDDVRFDGAVETVETLPADQRPTLVRAFPYGLQETGDGRTLEGLVVPYNRPQTVADPPSFEPYEEMFVPGAFRNAVKAPHRVLLDFEHYGAIDDLLKSSGSLQGALGHAVELEERDDGLWGRFRVLDHPDGDKALAFAKAKVLSGFSAAFKIITSARTPEGVVKRLKVHLDRVSLCRVGAYPEAQVLAIRTASVEREAFPDFDPELAASLVKYAAVPAELQGGTVSLNG